MPHLYEVVDVVEIVLAVLTVDVLLAVVVVVVVVSLEPGTSPMNRKVLACRPPFPILPIRTLPIS
jgi:hypothetical protein